MSNTTPATTEPRTDSVWDIVARERRRVAGELQQLTSQQWAMASQCGRWDIRHCAAHLLLPFEYSTPRFLVGLAASGFRFDAFAVKATARIAATHSNAAIIQGLRDHAENRWTPPGPKLGPEIPLCEILVHGQDIRRPLGVPCPVPAEHIEQALAAAGNSKMRDDFRRRISG